MNKLSHCLYLILSIYFISCNNNISNQIESIQYDTGVIEYQGSLVLTDGKIVQNELHKTEVQYYDKIGRVVITEFHDGEKHYSLFIRYDNGAIKVENIYNDEYKKVWRNEYSYYEDGNIKNINSYNKDGKLESKTLMVYDTNGNIIDIEIYNSDSTINNKTINEYTYNKLKKSTLYIENDDPVEKLYEYNNDGLLIKCDTYKYDNIVTTTEYSEYDLYRRVILTINYVYDEKNKRIPSTVNKFQYF